MSMFNQNDRIVLKQFDNNLEVYGNELFVTTAVDLLKESDLATTIISIDMEKAERRGYIIADVTMAEGNTTFDVFDFIYSLKIIWKTWICDKILIDRLAKKPVTFKEFIKIHEGL